MDNHLKFRFYAFALSCFLIIGLLPVFACNEQDPALTIHEKEIILPGLEKPYEIIFIADTHISLCDERDASLSDKAAGRYESFQSKNGIYADKMFSALIQYVKKEQPDLLIFGGDILDSAMYASIDFVQKELDTLDVPYIFLLGNHDFEYGEEYFSQTAYSTYLPRLNALHAGNAGYQLRETPDFNILAVDDAGSQVSTEALEALLAAKESEKPILLIMHVPIQPLEDEELIMLTKQVWGEDPNGNSKVLLGYKSCIPNETTTTFINEVCADDSLVKMVLAGHIHFYHEDTLGPSTTQITTGAGYEGELLKITLKP